MTIYKLISGVQATIIVLLIVLVDSAVRNSGQASGAGAEAKITTLPENKHQSFLDKNLDLFITKYDYVYPQSTPSELKSVKQYLKQKDKLMENKPNLFIFPNEIIQEEEEKFQKEILNNVIKKEVNIDEYTISENADIYGYPDSRLYENHPVKLVKNSNKIRSFSDFPYKISFEPKSLDIVDKY